MPYGFIGILSNCVATIRKLWTCILRSMFPRVLPFTVERQSLHFGHPGLAILAIRVMEFLQNSEINTPKFEIRNKIHARRTCEKERMNKLNFFHISPKHDITIFSEAFPPSPTSLRNMGLTGLSSCF